MDANYLHLAMKCWIIIIIIMVIIIVVIIIIIIQYHVSSTDSNYVLLVVAPRGLELKMSWFQTTHINIQPNLQIKFLPD